MMSESQPKKISRYDGVKLARLMMANKMRLDGTLRYTPTGATHEDMTLMEYFTHLANKYQIDFKTHGINSKGEIVEIPKDES